jgi:adenylosuccinate synthase
MGAVRLVSVLGLAFGDCGKGLFTDYLCRQWKAHTVVRFNGGAQAAHNVVLPGGQHHTFSQFGAGSFVPGTATVLAYPVVVHPTALLVESEYLRRAGVPDALGRLVIDGRCRVTTPFHQAAGRMRELERGAAAHGSCGVGVGETVRHAIECPEQVIRYADLMHPVAVLEQLEAIRQTLRLSFKPTCAVPHNERAYDAELAVLRDPSLSARWIEQVRELTQQVQPAERERVAERLHLDGTVVFEGAQGVLLDELRGFHPHTTWSSISTAAVETVAADAGQTARIHHLGALRTYLTRHGHGPLPTRDVRLDMLREPHNDAGVWQGAFRRAHPDALLLRYALAHVGELDGLLVSHLDVFRHAPGLRWCTAYHDEHGGDSDDVCVRDPESRLVLALRPSRHPDLEHQVRLAQLVSRVRPRYESQVIANGNQFVAELEGVAGLPVLFGSHGPTHETVRAVRPLPG